jgi:hypothetical protein
MNEDDTLILDIPAEEGMEFFPGTDTVVIDLREVVL